MEVPSGKKFKKRDNSSASIYTKCLIDRPVTLSINEIGRNLKGTIETKIKGAIEGKCLSEGYIKEDSSIIMKYSSGVVNGDQIRFDVVIECDVCFPVEDMVINCIAKNITKAGIRAESSSEIPSPIIVFIARDHHYNSQQFAKISEGDQFNVRVIGQRFELNDKYVSVIAELVNDNENNIKKNR
jgi:DNA-directed RNA polymerase subunit E'/Rpb7